MPTRSANTRYQKEVSFAQVKEQHAQAARAEAVPAGRPELCPTSRKLLEHIQGRSTIADSRVRVLATVCSSSGSHSAAVLVITTTLRLCIHVIL
jgi:hypothetical protein